MKVKVKTKDIQFFMPVPVGMMGLVIKLIPNRIFEEMKESIPTPYNLFITKEYIALLLTECIDILKENKGLEIIHVEAQDGTFISIKL